MREPWQMTKEELYQAVGDPSLEHPYRMGELEIVSWVMHPREGVLVDVIDKSRPGLHFTRESLEELHRRAVAQALSEGKPVPATVLEVASAPGLLGPFETPGSLVGRGEKTAPAEAARRRDAWFEESLREVAAQRPRRKYQVGARRDKNRKTQRTDERASSSLGTTRRVAP